jgi:hypothetical protein
MNGLEVIVEIAMPWFIYTYSTRNLSHTFRSIEHLPHYSFPLTLSATGLIEVGFVQRSTKGLQCRAPK